MICTIYIKYRRSFGEMIEETGILMMNCSGGNWDEAKFVLKQQND